MLENIFIYYVVILAIFAFVSLYKAYKGPTPTDRIISVNIILTKTATILCVMAVIADSYFYIDIAIVYALIGFIATVILAKFIDTKKLYRGVGDDS